MKIILYGNGGSGNHGCEAIVRGTQAVLKGEYIIQSNSPEEDNKYGLSGIINPAVDGKKSIIKYIGAYLKLKLRGDYLALDVVPYLSAIKKIRNSSNIALSVGGDNYCYSGEGFYAYLNTAYKKNGFKTVLWGCSIEPEKVGKESVKRDLHQYDVVVARESITYNAVKAINSNTFLAPDPAFFMEPEECELPVMFGESKIIGINAGPMIISNEKTEGIAYKNYYKLIKFILDNTDYSIALIPHVVWKTNDDRSVLSKLYEDFQHSKRIVLIEDHKAAELKYIISKCDVFVGARTHATIAAYSTCVPTLVVGYSVKARGIAKDLFGTEKNYVLPVQSLSAENQLTEGFIWIEKRKTEIKKRLKSYLPEYKKQMNEVVQIISAM